jgi:hypothetical protein
MIPVVKILFIGPPLYKFKHYHKNRFCMVTPRSEKKVPAVVSVLLHKNNKQVK